MVAALLDSGSGLNGVVDVLDWACIGRCFDYGNYEPSTGQFRIRISGPNRVAATVAVTQEIEYGHHIVTPQEAPLYAVCAAENPARRLELRELKAGEAVCGFSLAVTPQFRRPGGASD